MSTHQAFRRQPVPGQFAQQLQVTTIPAPTRGIVQHENDAFMGPGACIVSDNWLPTMKGVKLRGGSIRWCDLHALDAPAWVNAHLYNVIGAKVFDGVDGSFWTVAVSHTSAATGTFAADRLAHPTYWTNANSTVTRLPVISAFEYVSGNSQRMFAGQQTKLFDVTSTLPTLVKSGQTSGNYSSAQLANLSGYYLIAVNDAGDPPLRFNGTTWATLDPSTITAWANNFHYVVNATARDTTDNTYWKNTVDHTSAVSGTFAADRTAHPTYWTSASASDGLGFITGPIGTQVANGRNLSYVCKYRGRLFFIENKSMNLWYLPIDAIGGLLTQIPLSGAATKGGYLLFASNWSIDAGDGIDDKLVIATSEGELLVFTGSNPADPTNWRQEGRYAISPPLGMNAHDNVGGDLLIMTVDGIIPTSQAITKSAGELELALITRAIKRMWRDEVSAKRQYAWTMKKWDEYGGIFVTTPGGTTSSRYCLAMNNTTGAFCRVVGWDAMCFIRMRADMFFGTMTGVIMQADRTGYDDGKPYVATLVGGWGMFQTGSNEVVWHQARAVFASPPFEPFEPQITAATDYIVVIPPPPPAGIDPGLLDVWDQGHWGPPGSGSVIPPSPSDRASYLQWDQPGPTKPANRNTMWMSVGVTGFSHAPIVQVTVAQQAKPDVELIAIAATFERAGVNV